METALFIIVESIFKLSFDDFLTLNTGMFIRFRRSLNAESVYINAPKTTDLCCYKRRLYQRNERIFVDMVHIKLVECTLFSA